MMGYFYDNNIRKVPGPVYVYDYILTAPAIPGEIVFTSAGKVSNSATTNPFLYGDSLSAVRTALNSVQVGRYILFSPEIDDEVVPNSQAAVAALQSAQSFAGTIWQKVVENKTVKFTIVADRYTNPVDGVTGVEMNKIWNQVGYVESETYSSTWRNLDS